MQNIICELTKIPKFICVQLYKTESRFSMESVLKVVLSYPLNGSQSNLSQQTEVYGLIKCEFRVLQTSLTSICLCTSLFTVADFKSPWKYKVNKQQKKPKCFTTQTFCSIKLSFLQKKITYSSVVLTGHKKE